MISISQDPKESAQDFLFRAIELKDRLLVSSKEREEHFGAELVKNKFLRSVSTGLLNDNIKFQIKPYLDNLEVTDELLIERINEAANLETERLTKLKRNSAKTPRVAELQTTSNTWDSTQGSSSTQNRQPEKNTKEPSKEKTKVAHHPSEPEVNILVKELQTEVAEIKRMMFSSMSAARSTNSKQTTADNRDPRRRRGCRTCQDKGEGDRCSHCFKCGEWGHISRGCRVPRQAQGNDQGLLLRDRQ